MHVALLFLLDSYSCHMMASVINGITIKVLNCRIFLGDALAFARLWMSE